MKCKACGHVFAANWRSPAPGGFSRPGAFFLFNVLAAGAAVGLYLTGHLAYAVVAGVMLLFGIAANLTSWADSRVSMASDGSAVLGLKCPQCGTKHTIYPWSY